MRNLKRVLSLALALVMVLGMMVIGTSAATFTDDADIEYKEAIAVMNGIGLFQGNPDGSMKPDEVLTRAMAATILARIKLGAQAGSLKATEPTFTDVPLTDATKWYAGAVEYCYNTGLIDGNGDGTFNPNGKLTGIAFAKLLLVALGYDADEQGYVGKNWAANIAIDALANDLYIEGVDIAAELTREQAAQMLLQVMDQQMVRYTNTFDKATGASIISGPFKMTHVVGGETVPYEFMNEYYPTLKLTGAGHEEVWGRPYDYEWSYKAPGARYYDTLWTEWEEAIATYTTAKTHCEVAADYGMNYYVDHYQWFKTYTNGVADYNLATPQYGNLKVVATDTKSTIGAQGRLTEVYSDTIVFIDTFLAQVTNVTPVKYDAAGHKDVYATRTIKYWTADGEYTFTENSKYDYDEKKGDWLLINFKVEEKGSEKIAITTKNEDIYATNLEIVGEPTTLVGAQTIIWKLSNKHTVAGVTYDDAAEYGLDNAGNKANEQFTWFFDQYGNVIGSKSIAGEADKYATIAGIQWTNPEWNSGYAVANLVYVDGTTEQVVVYSIGDKVLGYALFEGDYETGAVSRNYAYNTEYVGKALFTVTKLADGVVALNELNTKADNVNVVKGNPIMIAGIDGGYLDDNTQFLVRTTVAGKFVYTPVTGYNQISTMMGATVYYVDLDSDYAAEIVYAYNGTPALSSSEMLVLLTGEQYSYVPTASGEYTHIKLESVSINGAPATVVVPKNFADTEIPDGIGYLYYMKDANGDGKVDEFKWLGEKTLANGYTAELVKAGSYLKLNNALEVTGVEVPYNTVGATVYGNWTGAETITIVYKGNVVAAVYVVPTP